MRSLHDPNAKPVEVFLVADALRRAGVSRLLSCDTIPHPSNALSVAPLLAAAIGDAR